MKSNNVKLSPLTEHQLARIQHEQPDTLISIINNAEISATDNILREARIEESFFPVIARTEGGAELFAATMADSSAREEMFARIALKWAIPEFLNSLRTGTKATYSACMVMLMRKNFIPVFDAQGHAFTLGQFRQAPHELIIDSIKKEECWSEGTRQVYAACYISFTAFLERITNGWFRKAIPNTMAANPTFYQIRDKCATDALTLAEWHRFIAHLHKINQRDSLIARCMLQGAKRISEVTSLTLDQLNWDKNIIRFFQLKTGGMHKEIPITYPQHFMDELKQYIENSSAIRGNNVSIFITRTGRTVTRLRLNYSFIKAADDAQIKRVTPHMLRATWVTLVKQQGVQDTEIMKVTGHTSSKMIYAYDKTSAEENVSKKLILI